MKRFAANGARIKQLRENDVRALKQERLAEMASMSVRKLRKVENDNDAITSVQAQQLGKALSVPWVTLVTDPAPKDSLSAKGDQVSALPSDEPTIIPRFDTALLALVKDPRDLIEQAQMCESIASHVRVTLNGETSGYVNDLLALVESLVDRRRALADKIGGRDEIAMIENLRKLLVLLKGNDLWVYIDACFKHLPESYEVQPRDKIETQFQLVIAFGPPGEWGEDRLTVPVDNGQPWQMGPGMPF